MGLDTIATTICMNMAMSLEELMMAQFSLIETATVTVRMLDGNSIPIRIRMSDSVSLFPKQFVDQCRMNPWITPRLRFYAREDWDEDAPLSGFVSVHRFRGTWMDLYRSEHQLPSCLHLVILDDEEEERNQKLALLRSILQSKGLTSLAELDNIRLYGEYLQWYLYYRPSETSFYFIKPNRYATMNAFVEHVATSSTTMNDTDEQMIMI